MTMPSIPRGREKRRGLRWLGLGLLLIILVAWLFLVITGQGLLIRYDPMAASETEPPFVESVACTYTSGLRTETVFAIGNKQDAECARLYEFGSLPPCPTVLTSPLVCEEVPS